MFKCLLCNKKFSTNQSLVSHLTHPKSSCKTNIKNYYNTFIRQSGEGICKYCGNETYFYGLLKGYLHDICGNCNNKNKDVEKNRKKSISIKNTLRKKRKLKEARNNLINLLRKQTIIAKNKFQCQICGKSFLTTDAITKHIKIHKIKLKEYYDKYFKSKNEDICLCSEEDKLCKKYVKFIDFNNGYHDYCSSKCVSLSSLVREDFKETCSSKYGVSHPTKDPEINKRQIQGIHRAWESRRDEILSKRKTSYRNNFIPKIENFIKVLDLELIEYNGSQETSIFKCLNCNNEYNGVWDYILHSGSRCPICFPKSISIQEKEFSDYIKSLFHPTTKILTGYRGLITNPKTGRALELDVYIPSKKIAFEYNGLYWHSELILNEPETYHITKTDECKKYKVKLIHIFEDEWMNKQDIVKLMIKYKLNLSNNQKIYARNCEIKTINPKTKNKFFDENHIQGRDKSSVKLGAFYKNELISAMTFGFGNITRGGNPNDKECWELSRFCSTNEYNVIGIAGKLLKYFERNYVWKEIYSFADLRISNGDMYYKLGFDLSHQTKPSYSYIGKGIKRLHRYKFRKTKDEPKDIPEWKLRNEQGLFRIWDCGKLKFTKFNTI